MRLIHFIPIICRSAATKGSYSCDSSGKITQVSSGNPDSTVISGTTTPASGGSGGTTTDVYVSDTGTQTTVPLTTAPSLPINTSSYTWVNAHIISSPNSSWTSLSGANWISTTSSNTGVETSNEGDAWRLFNTTFIAPSNVTNAKVYVAADNAFEFYLNGVRIATSADFSPSAPVYGAWPASGTTLPFTTVWIYNITPVTGSNTLTFIVRNWNNNGGSNPTGLIYKVAVTHQ